MVIRLVDHISLYPQYLILFSIQFGRAGDIYCTYGRMPVVIQNGRTANVDIQCPVGINDSMAGRLQGYIRALQDQPQEIYIAGPGSKDSNVTGSTL